MAFDIQELDAGGQLFRQQDIRDTARIVAVRDGGGDDAYVGGPGHGAI